MRPRSPGRFAHWGRDVVVKLLAELGNTVGLGGDGEVVVGNDADGVMHRDAGPSLNVGPGESHTWPISGCHGARNALREVVHRVIAVGVPLVERARRGHGELAEHEAYQGAGDRPSGTFWGTAAKMTSPPAVVALRLTEFGIPRSDASDASIPPDGSFGGSLGRIPSPRRRLGEAAL